MDEAEMMEIVIMALVIGAVIGAIPAISGAVKGKIGLAIGGFFACIVAQLILGVFLSIPVCAVFMFLIFKKPQESKELKE